jgi:hypothetical protein
MVILVTVTAVLGTFTMRETAFAQFSKDPSSSGLSPKEEPIIPGWEPDHALEDDA